MMEWKFKNKNKTPVPSPDSPRTGKFRITGKHAPESLATPGCRTPAHKFPVWQVPRSQERAQSPGDAAVADTAGPGATL